MDILEYEIFHICARTVFIFYVFMYVGSSFLKLLLRYKRIVFSAVK